MGTNGNESGKDWEQKMGKMSEIIEKCEYQAKSKMGRRDGQVVGS
jgi:hypothetical protein